MSEKSYIRGAVSVWEAIARNAVRELRSYGRSFWLIESNADRLRVYIALWPYREGDSEVLGVDWTPAEAQARIDTATSYYDEMGYALPQEEPFIVVAEIGGEYLGLLSELGDEGAHAKARSQHDESKGDIGDGATAASARTP